MRYSWLALAALLGVTAVTARAEYFRFIYNPGVMKKQADLPPDPNNPQAQQTIPANILNQLTPEQKQQLQSMSPEQQRQTLQRLTGMTNTNRANPRGGRQAPGMPMPGMGSGMSAPGMAGMGGRFGGGRGAGGLGGAGGMAGAALGDSSSSGMMGDMPGGMAGMIDPNAAPEEELDMDAIKAEVIVEVTNMHNKLVLWPGTSMLKVQHKWGTAAVDIKHLHENHDIMVQRVMEADAKGKYVGLMGLTHRWEKKVQDYQKKAGYPTAEHLLELAEYALTHGLQAQFDEKMTELVKLKPDHPSAIAYKKYQDADFKKTNLKDDPAAAWSEKLGDLRSKRTEHYLIRHDASTVGEVLDSYSKLLEDNFRAFYSWFALKGKYVPTPDYRLTALLTEKADDFNSLHKVFDVIALPADGFMSRRDNLTVMSGVPLNDGYDAFSRATQDLWVNQGFNKELVRKGDVKARGGKNSAEEMAYATTAAMLLRAMEDQSERQAVTHVGSLQLGTASGLFPRTVTAPQWVQFGIGSFFETPREAYWAGTGAPHWNFLTKFQLWGDGKKLDKPEEALRKVVTDAYFHEAHADKDAHTDHDRDAIVKARTMTWALTYFLAQQRLDQLLKYYKDLAAMPRDMELGEEALAAAFAQAFELGDGADALNSPKARELALKWYEFLMRDTHLEVAEVKTLAKKREEARVKRLAEEAKQKAFAAAQIQAARQAQMQSMQNMGQMGMQQGMQPGFQPGAMQPGSAPMGASGRPQGGFGSKKPGGGRSDQ